MKKIILIGVIALFAASASAQEYRQTRTRVDRNERRSDAYENRTNRDAYGVEGDGAVYGRTTDRNTVGQNTNNEVYGRTGREGFRTEANRWAVGPQIGIYMNTDMDGAVFGVGAYGRYSITNHWRVQPAVTALFESGCSVDISADIQYLFGVARRWDVYPQVGVGANDFGDWSCGIDFGVGTDFAVSRRWDVTASFKWIIQTASNRNDPFLINIGASYRF